MCVSKYMVSHTIIRFYTIFLSMTLIEKNMIRRSQKKNLITKKMRILYLNTTKKKSSRFITGVPRYLNFCEPKKSRRGKSCSIWGPL